MLVWPITPARAENGAATLVNIRDGVSVEFLKFSKVSSLFNSLYTMTTALTFENFYLPRNVVAALLLAQFAFLREETLIPKRNPPHLFRAVRLLKCFCNRLYDVIETRA